VGSNPTPRTISEHTAVSVILARYMNYLMTKKTLKPATIKRKVKCIKSLLNHGVILGNPDTFIRFLNTTTWASGTKDIAVDSYRDYLDMIGLTQVKLPHIRREEKLPFIPLESEIDALISYARAKTSTFLRVLKDTGVRPIEGWRLRWIDIDQANRCITITPAKYSRPRKLRISNQTLNMLFSLPRRNRYIFSVSGNKERLADELEHFATNFVKIRNRVAEKLKNPRLNHISLKTFRHWKATMEYVGTKDILHVKEMLGHKNIQNTLKYIHLANAISNVEDEFVVRVAKTVEDATELIEAGFEYVTDLEGVKLFRKRK
jgi:integrase